MTCVHCVVGRGMVWCYDMVYGMTCGMVNYDVVW